MGNLTANRRDIGSFGPASNLEGFEAFFIKPQALVVLQRNTWFCDLNLECISVFSRVSQS